MAGTPVYIVVGFVLLLATAACNEQIASAPANREPAAQQTTSQPAPPPPPTPKPASRPKPPDTLLSTHTAADALLDMVPEGTAFFWTNFAASPDAVPLVALDMWAPVYETAANGLQQRLRSEGKDLPFAEHLVALIDMLRGHFDTAGQRALGLMPTPRFVVYGLGAYPALRLEISDGKRLQEALFDLERRRGLEVELRPIPAGGAVRVYRSRGYVALVGLETQQAMVAVVPEAALDFALARMLAGPGESAPLKKSSRLTNLLTTLGGTDIDNVGAIQLERLAKAAIGKPDEGLAEAFAAAGGVPSVSGACATDWERIGVQVPRVAFASYGTASGQSGRIVAWFADPTVLSALQAAQGSAPMPIWHEQPVQPVAYARLAAPVADLAAALSGLADQLLATPFSCPDLTRINAWSAEVKLAVALLPQTAEYVDWALAVATAADLSARGVSAVEGFVALGTKRRANLLRAIANLPKRARLPRGAIELPASREYPAFTNLRLYPKKDMVAIGSGLDGVAQLQSYLRTDTDALAPGVIPPLLEAGYDYGRVLQAYVAAMPGQTEGGWAAQHQAALKRFGLFSVTLRVGADRLQFDYELRSAAGAQFPAPTTPGDAPAPAPTLAPTPTPDAAPSEAPPKPDETN